jgi:hypothetical protein
VKTASLALGPKALPYSLAPYPFLPDSDTIQRFKTIIPLCSFHSCPRKRQENASGPHFKYDVRGCNSRAASLA